MSQARAGLAQIIRRSIHTKTKSLPLSRLPQNSCLNIQASSPHIPVHVQLIPEWRDDGHIRLIQHTNHLEGGDTDIDDKIDLPEMDWTVKVTENTVRGLPTVDVSIHPLTDDNIPIEGETIEEEEIDMENSNHDDVDTSTRSTSGITLMAQIPEKCNITCKLNGGGDITVTKKLEGEDGFEFMTKGGNIHVDKLRGDIITLDNLMMGLEIDGSSSVSADKGAGSIFAKKSIEAQTLNVAVGQGGRFRAKMLNVSDGNVECIDGGESQRNDENEKNSNSNINGKKLDDDDAGAIIDVSSIYSSTSGDGVHLVVGRPSGVQESDDFKESLKKIRVKSNHGHISVRTASSFQPHDESQMIDEFDQRVTQVELGGVNGSFDVSIEKFGGANANADIAAGVAMAMPMAAKVHIDSLSPGQSSIVTSDFGDVDISLDRKIESDLRLLSAPLINNLDPNVLLEDDEEELVDALVQHDDDIEELLDIMGVKADSFIRPTGKDDRIKIETEAFSGHRNFDLDHVEYVQGAVDNKSEEPNSRFDVKTKGLGLASVGKIRIEGAAGQALNGFSGGAREADRDESGKDELTTQSISEMPLLAIATDGCIKVESLSWFGAIARRYGVKNEDRDRDDLGRQAKKSVKPQ